MFYIYALCLVSPPFRGSANFQGFKLKGTQNIYRLFGKTEPFMFVILILGPSSLDLFSNIVQKTFSLVFFGIKDSNPKS